MADEKFKVVSSGYGSGSSKPQFVLDKNGQTRLAQDAKVYRVIEQKTKGREFKGRGFRMID